MRGVVEGKLERFDGRITRLEVHLSDLNGRKLGERDKRCMMEARIGGMKPIAVTHEAPTLTEAIHVAADKLERAIGNALGRLQDMRISEPPEAQVASRGAAGARTRRGGAEMIPASAVRPTAADLPPCRSTSRNFAPSATIPS